MIVHFIRTPDKMTMFSRPGRLMLKGLLNVSTPCLSKRLRFLFPLSLRANSSTSISPAAIQDNVKPSAGDKILPEVAVGMPTRITGVQFDEKESRYYHQVMETLPKYRDFLFTREDLDALKCEVSPDISTVLNREDWKGASIQEIVDAFRLITSYALNNQLIITDPAFDHICQTISGRIGEFTDEQLIEVGKLHTLWNFPESPTAKNYRLLHQSYDLACCQRYQKEWFSSRNVEKVLKAADIFYWQRLGGRSHFLRLMVYHFGLKVKEPHHMIQIMYYLGLMRSVPSSVKFYDLERRLYSFSEHLSVTELAIFINSLFRNKSFMQFYPLMQDVFIKSLKSFSSLDDYLLVTISKGFKRVPPELKPLVALFQKRLLARADDFKVETVIHALWMFASNGVVNDDYAEKVFEMALKNISSLRSKEISRMLIVFTEFTSPNRNLKRLAECLIDELQTPEKEKWFKRKVFVQGATLHRLLICGVCPTKILDEYLRSMTSVNTANEALGVDVHLEVFYPDYIGARLSPHIREAVYKNRFQNNSNTFVKSNGAAGKRSNFNLQPTMQGKEVLLGIVDGKEDYILVKSLVPSLGYLDVVLCTDKDGIFRPIPRPMVEMAPWELTRIPCENTASGEKFLAITFTSTALEFDVKNIRWMKREKDAILEKLGYISVQVALTSWTNINNLEGKKTDLLAKIAEKLSK